MHHINHGQASSTIMDHSTEPRFRASTMVTVNGPNVCLRMGLAYIDCPELSSVFGCDVVVHATQVGGGPTATVRCVATNRGLRLFEDILGMIS